MQPSCRLWMTTALLFSGIVTHAPTAAAQYLAYVTTINNNQQGSVAVIDTATNAVVDSFPTGLEARFISASPDGAHVYVVNANSKDIVVFDALSRRIVRTVDFPNPNRMSPQGLAISPDGAVAYVSNGDNGFLEPGTVFVFDMTNGKVINQIPYDRANNMALSPDASTLYVDGNFGLGIIDTDAGALTGTLGGSLFDNDSEYFSGVLAVSPDGRFVYSVGCGWATDNTSGTTHACVTDTVTKTTASVPLGTDAGLANVIALSPDGRRLYLAYQDSGPAVLAVIDTTSREVIARIPVGSSPYGIATTPDGATVYVTNLASDTVSAISTATNSVIATIPVSGEPDAIAIAVQPGSATNATATPRPTRTPTSSPIPPPTATPDAVAVTISSATANRGDDVLVTATLVTGGANVAGVQNDITFGGLAPIVSCAVNPDIDKPLTVFSVSVDRVRAIVLGNNLDPIPDGSVLYTCVVHVGLNAALGAHYELSATHVIASDPTGRLLAATGTNGYVTVARPPRSSPTTAPTATPTETRPPLPACGAVTDTRTLAYVANFDSNSVSIIDTRCGMAVGTVQLSVGIAPLGVAVAPDGHRVYVSTLNPGAVPQLAVIDTATNTVAATVGLGAESDPAALVAHSIAVSPDSASIYVIDDSRSAVVEIDSASHTVTAQIPVSVGPHAIALSADGRAAYVTHGNPCYYSQPVNGPCKNGIDVVDLDPDSATFRTVTRTVFLNDGDPVGIAVTRDGIAYTTDTYNPSSTVSALDLATGNALATIGVASSPLNIVASPDGHLVYLTSMAPPVVSVIDTATNTVTATIALDAPTGIALTPDGQSIGVTNEQAETVSFIDAATNRVTAIVPVGLAPRAIAIGQVPAQHQASGELISGSAPPAGARTDSGGCAVAPTGGFGIAPLLTLLALAGRRHGRTRHRTMLTAR